MPSTIFITGASSGIGLASAKLFFKEGWAVVATMRSPESAVELKQLDPSRMLLGRVDLLEPGTIEPAIDAAIQKFGKIDVVLNNAGFGQYGVFEMMPPEKIREQFDVNLFGVMNVTRTVLPHFRAQKSGCVISVSSGAGLYALPVSTMYCSSKFALEGFTESLSYELAPHNIFVKSVIPHSGISSTNFLESAKAKIAMDLALAPAYGEYLEKIVQKFESMAAGTSTSAEDVAKVIFTASTDGANKLRYLVGTDEKGSIKARYDSRSDEEYMKHMRSIYNE